MFYLTHDIMLQQLFVASLAKVCVFVTGLAKRVHARMLMASTSEIYGGGYYEVNRSVCCILFALT